MKDVTLVILAGGESSRMGTPKVDLQIHGEPILRRMLNRTNWPGETMLVLAPGMENPDGAERLTQVVRDPVAGVGPLRGILTALQHTKTASIVVIPIDMPALSRPQLEWIALKLEADPELLGLMLTRPSTDGTELIEPFPSAFRNRSIASIEKHLAAGRRAVHSLAKLTGFRTVQAPADWSEIVWTNLNTPAQRERWERGGEFEEG